MSARRRASAVLGLLLAVAAGCSSATPSASTNAPIRNVPCPMEPGAPTAPIPQQQTVTVVDETGAVTECRRVTGEEATAIRGSIGPAMPDQVTVESLEISAADPDQKSLLVLWVVVSCDGPAQVLLRPSGSEYELYVGQRRRGECAPGTALAAIVMTLSRPIPATSVHGQLSRLPMP
ncbi:MAG TPA: hypothetical protein VF013_01395 [Candidatus Limnocylindria bacterium]